MATINSLELQNTQSSPRVINSATADTGRIRVKTATYNVSALNVVNGVAVTQTATDVLNLFTLPAGARIIRFLEFQNSTGSTNTLSIGTAAAPALYRTAAVHTTLGQTQLAIPSGSLIVAGAGLREPLLVETPIIATSAALILPVGTYMFTCEYVVD